MLERLGNVNFSNDNFSHGENNKVGTKGFDILGYDGNEGAEGRYKITGTEADASAIQDLVPVEYSIAFGGHWDHRDIITEATWENDALWLTVSKLFTKVYRLDGYLQYNLDNFINKAGSFDVPYEDDATLFICGYPELGTKPVHYESTAFGHDNTVQSEGGIAAGKNHLIVGNYGAAFGRDGVSGYATFTAGNKNEMGNTQYSVALGENNQVTITENSSDKVQHDGIVTNVNLIGTGLKSGHNYQTVLGLFNENKKDTLLEIGVGSDDKNRKNAMEVDNNHKDPTIRFNNIQTNKISSPHFSVTNTGFVSSNPQYPNSKEVTEKYLSGQLLAAQGFNYFSSSENLIDTNTYRGVYVGGPAGSHALSEDPVNTTLPYTFNINGNFGAYISIDPVEINPDNQNVIEPDKKKPIDYFFVIMKIKLIQNTSSPITLDYIDAAKFKHLSSNTDKGKDIGNVMLEPFSSWGDTHYVICPFRNEEGTDRQGIYFNNTRFTNATGKVASYDVVLEGISVYKAAQFDIIEPEKIEFFSSTVSDMNRLLGRYQASVSTKEPPEYIVGGIYDTSSGVLTSLIVGNTQNNLPATHIKVYSSEQGNIKLKSYIDSQIGNIDAALDELHASVQAFI